MVTRALRAAAAVVAALLVAAHPAVAAAPRALAGTTVIDARWTASATDVVVPRQVAFGGDCFPEVAVTVQGSARSVVLSLIPADRRKVATFFGRLDGRSFSTACGVGSSLEAGRYRLVVLRSSGTARVTLRLAGLTGVTTVPTTARTGAVLAELAPVSPYSATGGRAGSFSATRRLAGQGLVSVFGYLDGETSAVSTLGDCEVSGVPAALLPTALAQAPGCPLGGSGQSTPGPKGPGTDFHAGGTENVAGNDISLGFFFQSSTAARAAGAFGIWIPYAT